MLRITGGKLRGRRISAPKGSKTRPTPEKVRQGIFNVLAGLAELVGGTVLDLFAGSGALGIEALSRGAARVIFVESHPRTAAGIRANLEGLQLEPDCWRVAVSTVHGWLGAGEALPPPGIILLDPPYQSPLGEETLSLLAASAAIPKGAVIVLESSARGSPAIPAGLELLRMKRYGDTQVLFLEKSAGPDHS